MKKLFKITMLYSFMLAIISCNNDIENFSGDAAEGGAVVSLITNSPSKALGVPASQDLANATVSFAETDVNFDVNLQFGGFDITNYELVKTLNGSGTEVVESTSATLPIHYAASTIDDLIIGLGIASTDLRIGDQIIFRTRMTNSNGSVYYAADNEGSHKITISCSSNLAGAYDLTTHRDNGADVFFPGEIISEVSPGYYKTTSIYRWAVGSIAPDQGFNFNDVCGEIKVPLQGLAQGYYSNDVEGTDPGTVDAVTGDLEIKYYVSFSSGNVNCVGNYVKL